MSRPKFENGMVKPMLLARGRMNDLSFAFTSKAPTYCETIRC